MATKKTTFTATFANGTVATRTSHRPYTHAWRVGPHTGFSASYDNARKQAANWLKYNPTMDAEVAVAVAAA